MKLNRAAGPRATQKMGSAARAASVKRSPFGGKWRSRSVEPSLGQSQVRAKRANPCRVAGVLLSVAALRVYHRHGGGAERRTA
jgi:hypothetical protein